MLSTIREKSSPRSRQTIPILSLVLLGVLVIGIQTRFPENPVNWLTGGGSFSAVLDVLGGLLVTGGIVLRVLALVQMPRTYNVTGLVTGGIYSRTRNPVYFGFLLIVAGLTFLVPGWLTLLWSLIGVAVLYGLSKVEESDLEDAFGEEYLAYKRNVPRFFPRLKPNRST